LFCLLLCPYGSQRALFYFDSLWWRPCKVLYLKLYSWNYFWLVLPIVHHGDTIVPNRTWPSPLSFTDPHRSWPSLTLTVTSRTVRNGQKRWRTVRNGLERWGTMTIVSWWWTECHHGTRWPENGNGTVNETNHNFGVFKLKNL
jgi:hypothetical protein